MRLVMGASQFVGVHKPMLGVSQIAALHGQAAEHLPAPAFTPAVAGGLCLFERMHEVFACLLEFAFVVVAKRHIQLRAAGGSVVADALETLTRLQGVGADFVCPAIEAP